MNLANQPSASRAQITPAQIVELWGDSPIYPGPSWRLSWPLESRDQKKLAAEIRDGLLWSALRLDYPALAELSNPWQSIESMGADPTVVVLSAIAAFAKALLLPATLEVCDPFLPLKRNSTFLVV